jgi:Kyakuja-Dileera-Zisupton transposase
LFDEYLNPSLFLKLVDEPHLYPARLHAMDGNNSMKRVGGSGHADERVFSSDYYITPAEVDIFKDDVRRKDSRVTSLDEPGTLPCEGDDTVCANKWQAANGVSFENSAQIFDQCGGFISACRHGMIESLIEMRQSGEL